MRTSGYGISEADARLIVAAVNALPALLDVVEAARAYRAAVDASESGALGWGYRIGDAQDALDAAIARVGGGA